MELMLVTADPASLCVDLGPMTPQEYHTARQLAITLRSLHFQSTLLPLTQYCIMSKAWLEMINAKLVEPVLGEGCQESRPNKFELPVLNSDLVLDFNTPEQDRRDLMFRLKPSLLRDRDFLVLLPQEFERLSAFQLIHLTRKTDLRTELVLQFPYYRVLCSCKSLLASFEYGRAGLLQFELQFDGGSSDLYRLMERIVRENELFNEIQTGIQEELQIFMLDKRISLDKYKSLILNECERCPDLNYLIPVRGQLLKDESCALPEGELLLVEILEKDFFSFYEKNSIPKCRCKGCEKIVYCQFKCDCDRYRYCSAQCLVGDEIHQNYCGKKALNQTTRKSYLQARSVAGRHGISNIGNTCYLSAALQCLFSYGRQLPELPSKSQLSIQVNKIGVKLQDRNSQGSVDPRAFLEEFKTIFPLYRGFQQQDAHQFLSLLIDRLHQQARTIQSSPTVSTLSSITKRGWQEYMATHHSGISQQMFGMVENTVTCQSCKQKHIKHEPFQMLSLALPAMKSVNVQILSTANDLLVTRAKYIYREGLSLHQVRSYFSQRMGCQHLLAFYSNLERARHFEAPLGLGELVVVRQAYQQEIESKGDLFLSVKLTRSHFKAALDPNRKSLSKARGFYLPSGLTVNECKAFLKKVMVLLLEAHDFKLLGPDGNELSEESRLSTLPRELELVVMGDCARIESRTDAGGDKSIDIQECLNHFCQEERLPAGEWICANQSCSKEKGATIKSGLLRVPNLLIIHFKRFAKQSFKHSQKKIGVKVSYPLHQFNLGEYCIAKEDVRYEVSGICNHHGSLAFGHYTAICKDEQLEKWLEYNDTQVREVEEEGVCSGGNYLVFLKRKVEL